MKKFVIKLIIFLLFIFIVAIKYIIDAHNAVDSNSIENMLEQEREIVKGKCSMEEDVNRHLLQQTWFYDDQYTLLAGAFGTVSFSMYKKGVDFELLNEGSFCINGKDLIVRYFETSFVPKRIIFESPFGLGIRFGRKIKPMGEDIYTVKELTKKRMILGVASDGRDHIFYRKN